MVTLELGHIGSGNGLLPDGTMSLPEPIVTYHQHHMSSDSITKRTSIDTIPISKIRFENCILKIAPRSPKCQHVKLSHLGVWSLPCPYVARTTNTLPGDVVTGVRTVSTVTLEVTALTVRRSWAGDVTIRLGPACLTFAFSSVRVATGTAPTNQQVSPINTLVF